MSNAVVEMYQKNVPVYLISKSMNLTEKEVMSIIVDFSFTLDLLNIDLDKMHKEYIKYGEDRTLEKFQISYSALVYFLIRNDDSFFTKTNNGKFIWPNDVLARLYLDEYLSSTTIAAIFNCSLKAVKSEMMRENIPTERRSKYNLNHDFFSKIDSEEKAYWLGFMFADGSVDSSNNTISIKLNDVDIDHLNKFSQALGFTGPIETGPYTTPNGVNKLYCRIRFSSPKMKKDLMALGCVPNKTYNMAVVPDIDSRFELDFIRGVVDGDGHISNNKKRSQSFQIVGTKILIEWIRSIVLKNFPEGVIYITPYPGCFRLTASGKYAEKIIKEIYENSKVYLNRKYKIVEENIL